MLHRGQELLRHRLNIQSMVRVSITQLTHVHTATATATAHVSPHVHYTYTSYVLCAYLYCVYVLVGGAISIRDPYICAVHESVPMNHTLSSTDLLSVQ